MDIGFRRLIELGRHEGLDRRDRVGQAALRRHRRAPAPRREVRAAGLLGKFDARARAPAPGGVELGTAAAAAPACRSRSAQKNWSPANGTTTEGTPALASGVAGAPSRHDG